MTLDRTPLLRDLATSQPADDGPGPVSVPALVKAWLAADGATGEDDRVALEALCRQIDVRRRISVAYGDGFRRRDDETPAPPAVVAGVAAVLLCQAPDVAAAAGAGERNDGWGLKCINSALKAIDLGGDGLPHRAELTGWAFEALDRAAVPGAAAAGSAG